MDGTVTHTNNNNKNMKNNIEGLPTDTEEIETKKEITTKISSNITNLENDYKSFLNAIDHTIAVGIKVEETQKEELVTINLFLTGIGKRPDEENVVCCKITDFYVTNSAKARNNDSIARIRRKAEAGIERFAKLFLKKRLYAYIGKWHLMSDEDLGEFLIPLATTKKHPIARPKISLEKADGYKGLYCVPYEHRIHEFIPKKLEGDELKIYDIFVSMMCATCPTRITAYYDRHPVPFCPYQMRPVLHAAYCTMWGRFRFENGGDQDGIS